MHTCVDGMCLWEWDGSAWQKIAADCAVVSTPECATPRQLSDCCCCDLPADEGSFVGETVETNCFFNGET